MIVIINVMVVHSQRTRRIMFFRSSNERFNQRLQWTAGRRAVYQRASDADMRCHSGIPDSTIPVAVEQRRGQTVFWRSNTASHSAGSDELHMRCAECCRINSGHLRNCCYRLDMFYLAAWQTKTLEKSG